MRAGGLSPRDWSSAGHLQQVDGTVKHMGVLPNSMLQIFVCVCVMNLYIFGNTATQLRDAVQQ
jgi:hypothetical protein